MKLLILLMSCNNPEYEEEEIACRETFLRDAKKYKDIDYWFYKGLNNNFSSQTIDYETHTLYIDANDALGGTGEKTIKALKESLTFGYDYLLKTNVSTYLNVKKIRETMEQWDGADDLNIYGGRFIVNKYSKNVPFPRGYFSIFSRKVVEGVVEWGGRLVGKEGIPKTDDTLIGLASLFYLQKILGYNYVNHLMEVPSIASWPKNVEETPGLQEMLSIRCKFEKDRQRTVENMRLVDKVVRGGKEYKKLYRPFELVETAFGMMPYERYLGIAARIEAEERENPTN